MIEDMINLAFAMILSLLVGIMVPSWLSDRAYQSLLNGIAVVCTTVAIATAGVAVYQMMQYDAKTEGRFVDSNGLMRSNAEADIKCQVAVMILGEKIAAATNPPPVPDGLPKAVYHHCLFVHNRFI